MQKAPDLMATAVTDALGQLEALRNRYAHLNALADVWEAIDAAIEKHAKRRRK